MILAPEQSINSTVTEMVTMAGGDDSALVVMFHIFLDDSADPKRERYTAVGGIAAAQRQWDLFELLWISATADLPGPFHATDCECHHGDFATWTKPQSDKLMAQLVDLVHSRKVPGWGAVVDVPAYRSVFPNSRSTDPFFLAVKYTIGVMAKVGSILNSDVHLWFEESQEVQSEINKIYLDMKAVKGWHDARRLAEITFLSKRRPGAQAADLIAREAFKHFDNLGKRGTRKPVKRLQRQLQFQHYNQEALEQLRENGGPDNLALFTTEQNEMDWTPDPLV